MAKSRLASTTKKKLVKQESVTKKTPKTEKGLHAEEAGSKRIKKEVNMPQDEKSLTVCRRKSSSVAPKAAGELMAFGQNESHFCAGKETAILILLPSLMQLHKGGAED